VRRRPATERRGVSLVLVLAAIAVLTSVTAVAAAGARRSVRQAEGAAADAVARAMAESAVVAARVRLERAMAAAPDSEGVDAVLAAATQGAAEGSPSPFVADSLARGGFAAVVVDVNARLDVNLAGAEGLARLFAAVVPRDEAERVARTIAARVTGTRPAGEAPREDSARWRRDSLAATLLGRALPPRRWHPFESLDELQALPEVASARWLGEVAEELTVDGDGRINRRRASPRVVAAAAGSLVDRPTRLLVVGRGWAGGRRGTREIQAVFDVTPPELRLVTWREQFR
jgi:type II secretory pathway component PulK